MEKTELQHWGIKGMKWGVRRYRNKDGTLTPAGKKRYGDDDVHEDYKKAHEPKSIKSMSNSELKSRNNRLQMEKQYRDLTKKQSKGKKLVTSLVATAGTIASVGGAYNTYKKYGKEALNKAVDVVGNMILRDLTKNGL